MYLGKTAFVVQKNTFYPFSMKVAGMCWQTSSSKFIGKDREEIDEMDLDWIYWEKRFLEK